MSGAKCCKRIPEDELDESSVIRKYRITAADQETIVKVIVNLINRKND